MRRPATECAVHIVSEHHLVVERLSEILQKERGVTVAPYRKLQPVDRSIKRIFLIDAASLELPLETVLRTLASRDPEGRMLVIAGKASHSDPDPTELLYMGIDGWLRQEDAGSCLIEAIRSVIKGLLCVRVDRIPPLLEAPAGLFSEREREVYGLLRRRFSNREIAEALGIGESTAKSFVAKIMASLGVDSRRDLTIEGTRQRLARAASA